jgi:hypothetical protein
MTLIRFEGSSDRGPSGTLWNSLVDWVRGTLAVPGGCLDAEDFFPYNSASVVLSGDGGSAATVSAVQFGVVSFAASAGTYAVAGYARPEYIDLTSIRQVCREVRFSRTAGATGAEISFIGFSDQAPEAVFHSDGTLDGGSAEDQLGLRWNDDLTVDLVSVVNGTATILSTALATAVSNTGFHKFGLRIVKLTSTKYSIYSSVDGVVTVVHVASTAISQVAMRPVAVTTISATDAPVIVVDWDFTLDSTPGAA